MKRIQGFLEGDIQCEIDGYLVGGWSVSGGFVAFTVREIDSKHHTEYILGAHHLRMVRIWEERANAIHNS